MNHWARFSLEVSEGRGERLPMVYPGQAAVEEVRPIN